MGLNEIYSGQMPEKKENILNQTAQPKDGSKIDSIMTNPDDNVRLADEQKLSIMSNNKNQAALSYDELWTLARLMQHKSDFSKKLHVDKECSLFTSLSASINQNILGIGYNADDVDKASESELKIYGDLETSDDIQVEKIIKEHIKSQFGIEPTNENLRKILNGEINLKEQPSVKLRHKEEKSYEHSGEGLADLVSGIAAFRTYSKMIGSGVKHGKLAILLALGRAALTGGTVKTLFKGADKLFTNFAVNLEYSSNNDIEKITTDVVQNTYEQTSFSDISNAFLTGAFSGVLAPITGGIGGLFGKKVAAKAGLKVVEYGTEKVIDTAVKNGFKQNLKSIFTNFGGYRYTEGSKLLVGATYASEMALDGALGGVADCGFRAAVNGDSAEEIKDAVVQGGITGAIFAPAIGGIFKFLAKRVENNTSEISSWIGKQKARMYLFKTGRSKEDRELILDFAYSCLNDENSKLIKQAIKDKSCSAKFIKILMTRYKSNHSFFRGEKVDKFIEDFCFGKYSKMFSKDDLCAILGVLSDQNVDFITKMIQNNKKQFTPKELVNLINAYADSTLTKNNKECHELIERLIFGNEFNLSKEETIRFVGTLSEFNCKFAESLLKEKDVPLKIIPEFLKYFNRHGMIYDSDGNVIETISIAPEIKQWMAKNFESGLEEGEVHALLGTQKKLWQEAKQAQPANKTNDVIQNELIPKATIIKEAEEEIIKLGVHPKMAEKFIEKCHINGQLDNGKFEMITNMLKVFNGKKDTSQLVKEMDNIFDFAYSEQLKNVKQQFILDILNFKRAGIEDIKLMVNLSAIKNMDLSDMVAKFNTKQRQDLVERVQNLDLPSEVKTKLGLDKIVIRAKTETKNVKPAIKKEPEYPPHWRRAVDDLTASEKEVYTRFKHEITEEKTWRDPDEFKKWAEKRLKQVMDIKQNPNYTATGQYAIFNKKREEGIRNWYKYLTTQSNYRKDPFVHLLFMDGITKEMRPNNAVIPPAISHADFERTYNAILAAGSKKALSKIYAEQIKERAIKLFGKEQIVHNGIEGRWVKIPCTKKGAKDFEEHVAMVQALSEGSNWCLRYSSAEDYLNDGNLHFFVDKFGDAQVAIHEKRGKIKQIQKRYHQNSTVPVAYSEIIAKWAKKYRGFKDEIKRALKAKPAFDKLKARVDKLMSENDYLGVFKAIGIDVRKADDGTFIISDYKVHFDDWSYTLRDLGVDENKLMSNVSEVCSDLNLSGSSITVLPNLRIIKGKLKLGDCHISDFRSLEEIQGHKIYWDK